jgi:hypothetical protein
MTTKSMNLTTKLLGLCLVATIAFFSCRKSSVEPTSTNEAKFTNNTLVNATVTGQLFDESGMPLANATVTTGNHTFTTSANGVFYFNKINTLQNATLITVTKAGYFTGYRTLYIKKGVDNFTKIRVMKMDNLKTFTSTSDATIPATNGALINIAKNSIMTESTGKLYNGVVSINAKMIRALDANIDQLTPGALRGINAAGIENALGTYGMLAVEMKDASGNALQIATGTTAEIIMPIEPTQLASAPATIPLWHFDAAKAMWVEDGVATKTGNTYVGRVSHFSYWNCDYPTNIVMFDVTVTDSVTGNPLPGVKVQLVCNLASAGTRSSWTNASGYTGGGIPKNASYVMNLIDNCGNIFYSQTFSVTTANISLGTIAVNLPAVTSATMTGNVIDCAAAAIPNAMVLISQGNSTNIVYADALGNFTYTTTLCSSPIAYTFEGFNPTTYVSGSSFASVSAGVNAIGTVTACGTVNEYINYTIADGTNNNSFTALAPDNFSSNYNAPSTSIYANGTQASGTTTYKGISFSFDGAGTIGAHTITIFNHFSQSNNTFYSVSSDSSSAISVPCNITQYSPVLNGFISGNWNGTFSTINPAMTYTITGNFNVKRKF